MNLRTALIVSWPMAQPGAVLAFDEIAARGASFLAALKVDLPCLQQLQASEVVHDVQLSEQGMTWRATLVETSQMALRFTGNGVAAFDHFQQDHELVRQAQNSLPLDYRLALSDAREPSLDTRTASLRQRMRRDRQGRNLHIAARTDQCELLLPEHLPHHMPLAEVCQVHVRILNMSRTRALIKLAVALHLPTSHATMPAGTELQLLRGHRFADVEAGHRLQVAMDTRQVLLLQAAATRRWEDGTVHALELHAIQDN